MQRYYKLPVLLSIIENDGSVDYETMGKAFRDFYMLNKQHHWDFVNDKKNQNFEKWGLKEFLSLALENPVKFLARTEHEFIKHDEINKRIYFADEIVKSWSD